MKSKWLLPALLIAIGILLTVFLVDVFKGGLFHQGEKQKLYETPHSETTVVVDSVVEEAISNISTAN